MTNIKRIITAILLLLASICSAQVNIDTGPGEYNFDGGYALYNRGVVERVPGHPVMYNQELAAEFTVVGNTNIASVAGWIGTIGAGAGSISVASNLYGVPGVPLYSKSLYFPEDIASSWRGVDDLNWVLSPGAYWVIFARDFDSKSFGSFMTWGALDPLEKYAASSVNFTGEISWEVAPLDLGVRIMGSAIPEPAVCSYTGASICLFFCIYRQFKARQKRD